VRRLAQYRLLAAVLLGAALGVGIGFSVWSSSPIQHSVRTHTATPTLTEPDRHLSAIVPQVTGELLSQAEARLVAEGLNFSLRMASSSSVPESLVITESPSAGVRVAQGSQVDLTISSGPPD